MSDQHRNCPPNLVPGYLPNTEDPDVFVNLRVRHQAEVLRLLNELMMAPGTDQQLLAIGRAAIERAFRRADNQG
jgi:hypothetical protein